MKLKLFSILFTSFLLTACVFSRFGDKPQEILSVFACYIDQERCLFNYGEVNARYSLLEISDGNFTLEGDVDWRQAASSADVAQTARIDLIFLFLNDLQVVDWERVRVSGSPDTPLPYSLDFSTKQDIQASVLAEYRLYVSH